MSENAPKRNLITLPEAMKRLCCRRSKAYDLINSEKIIAYKDGHRTLIDEDSITAYQLSLKRYTGAAR